MSFGRLVKCLTGYNVDIAAMARCLNSGVDLVLSQLTNRLNFLVSIFPFYARNFGKQIPFHHFGIIMTNLTGRGSKPAKNAITLKLK